MSATNAACREPENCVDYEILQRLRDREYERAYTSPEVLEWEAGLSADQRAEAVAAGVLKPNVSHAAPAKGSKEAEEAYASRIGNITRAEVHRETEGEKFATAFEAELLVTGEKISPAVMGAAVRAFTQNQNVAAERELWLARRETTIRVLEIVTGSKSRETALRGECLMVAMGDHPDSLSVIGERFTPPGARKKMTKQNVSKIAKSIRAELPGLAGGGTLKDDDYSALARARAYRVHARRKGDATASATKQLPCLKKPSSLLNQAFQSPQKAA